MNANGIVGNPAEPTVAPGGSVAVVAWVGVAAVLEAAGVEDEDDDELLDEEDEPLDEEELLDDVPPPLDTAPAVAAAGVAGVGPCPAPADSFRELKSMRALWAAVCSW
jgi:hypothetical protein